MQIFLITYDDIESDQIFFENLVVAEKEEDLYDKYDPNEYDISAINDMIDHDVVVMTSEQREAFDIIRAIKVPLSLIELRNN